MAEKCIDAKGTLLKEGLRWIRLVDIKANFLFLKQKKYIYLSNLITQSIFYFHVSYLLTLFDYLTVLKNKKKYLKAQQRITFNGTLLKYIFTQIKAIQNDLFWIIFLPSINQRPSYYINLYVAPLLKPVFLFLLLLLLLQFQLRKGLSTILPPLSLSSLFAKKQADSWRNNTKTLILILFLYLFFLYSRWWF